MTDGVRAGGQQEHISVYQRFRSLYGDPNVRSRDGRRRAKRDPGESVPFGAGRDPKPLGSVVDVLTEELGWTSPLAKSSLIDSWGSIVGEELAAQTRPESIDENVLTVRCASTAWATQLRMMRADILTRMLETFPEAGVDSVRFVGPDTPSWKRGPRSIQGRGPRDTYG